MSIVKIQVPIEKTLRDKLEARATKLGFDSVQAYIRFWATAEADGRRVNFGEDEWGEPSPEATARLNKTAEEAKRDIKSGKLKSFTNTEEALDYLHSL